MRPISFKRHRFPAEVIRHAVWLYFRFTLSLRDVEEMMAQRGIEVSYETIRCVKKRSTLTPRTLTHMFDFEGDSCFLGGHVSRET